MYITSANRIYLNKREQSNFVKNEEKNPNAVELGRLGGLKGGKARAKKLSAKKRSEIAKSAALARWNKKNKK